MYGDQAHQLTLAAKRTLALPQLPPYAADLVRAIVREVRDLDRDVNALLQPFTDPATGQVRFDPAAEPGVAARLLVNHLSMRRDKRCLLAYHRVRTDKLEGMVWDGVDLEAQSSAALASDSRGQQQQQADDPMDDGSGTNSLSPEEEEYTRQFSDLLAAYKGHWTDIDLTGSLEPPKELFVDVRVLKDAGEIQTEYGSINLTRNSQFYVRLGDVERLIGQGYLQRLD